ncbi:MULTISPECIES: cytochrome c3 family protein [Thiorhodovibrio]|uniref:cytochrome c3 family protein n=1 Tax=Thiorhodovibrio TaxID=61593 RepID=UPI001911AC93|nr:MULTISPECIES: NapC/NirT family cytochrome c [Thiorhodovibrio]MBK5968516.1 hypothetical protein [Thiorhodovibrio winogradskyi]WPL13433.1 Cytochrome c-type protein TorY [Thiorhodovibrio litoralis]
MLKRLTNRLFLFIALLLVLVPAVMALSWIGTETVLQETADAEFCGSCHSMTPFVETHAEDVHGGNNAGGVVANCADCHLPHTRAQDYLHAKIRTGVHDVLAQGTAWLHPVDWLAKREERDQFVYDSGCLTCHSALKNASKGDPAALAAHKGYFSDQALGSCVSCHAQVGHKDLRAALAEHFDHVPPARAFAEQ